jgi:hypothetical protein
MVSMTAVRELDGSWVTAGCFQRIAWRTERDGYWTATMQEIADEIGVSVRTAHRITQRLRDLGWITGERENRWDPTLTWRVIWAPTPGAREAAPQDAKSAVTSLETVETTTRPHDAAASVPAGPPPVAGSGGNLPRSTNRSTKPPREGPMSSARIEDAAADEPLAGMPAPAAKEVEPSAGALVAAWCGGWTETRGEQPHPSLVRRVAGICRNVAKDCGDVDDWRAAWRAARSAGRDGRWDIVTQLAAPVALGKGNHHLALARDPSKLLTGGLLGGMLGQPTTAPHAIGDAS